MGLHVFRQIWLSFRNMRATLEGTRELSNVKMYRPVLLDFVLPLGLVPTNIADVRLLVAVDSLDVEFDVAFSLEELIAMWTGVLVLLMEM